MNGAVEAADRGAEAALERFEALANGKCEQDADLFEAETIERMTSHYERLLERVTADPDRSVWEFSLLTEAEQEQIVALYERTLARLEAEIARARETIAAKQSHRSGADALFRR